MDGLAFLTPAYERGLASAHRWAQRRGGLIGLAFER